jgi:hypothetical protein
MVYLIPFLINPDNKSLGVTSDMSSGQFAVLVPQRLA